jgi:dimethylargininase
VPGRPLALVRSVPDTFTDAIVPAERPAALDPAQARRQHAGYCAALASGGFSVRVIPADEAHPDSPFVEDTAVVIGERALVTRPGHPARRGEVGPVAEVLERVAATERMREPARLDGGDVLVAGSNVFVGRSSRSDDHGIEALAHFAARAGRTITPVDVGGVLHLKSAVTAVDDRTVVAYPDAVDLRPFSGFDVLDVGGKDPEAANVVRLPDGSIMVAAHHEDTARLLARRGMRPVVVDVSEFARAGGGLTCLSIRLRSVLVAPPTYAPRARLC